MRNLRLNRLMAVLALVLAGSVIQASGQTLEPSSRTAVGTTVQANGSEDPVLYWILIGILAAAGAVTGLKLYRSHKNSVRLKAELNRQKIEQDDLQVKYDILRTIFDQIKDVLSIMKPDNTIISYNQAGYQMLKVEPGQAEGKRCFELVGRDKPCDICASESIKQTKQVEMVSKFVPELGRWVEATAIPVTNDAGELEYIVEQVHDITHNQEINARLREAYSIINQSPFVAFVWKNELNWPTEYVSENVDRLLGYSAEDFISQRQSYAKMIHPEDLERVVQEVEEHDWSVPLSHKPYRVYDRDGNMLWVDSRVNVRRDESGAITHYEGIIFNISDRIAIEQKYRESQEQMSGILSAVEAGICMINRDYQIVWANELYTDYFGPEIVGSVCYQYHHQRKHRCNSCPICESMADGQSHRQEVCLKDSQGHDHVFWCSSSIAERNEKGEAERVVAVLADITDQKKIERELMQSKEEIQSVNEQLEHAIERANQMAQDAVVASQAKSSFLANMSHEIRTPMNAIIGFGDLLAMESITDTQREYVNIIRESGDHLLGLINDVLDFSKIEAAKIELEQVSIGIDELNAQIAAMLQRKAEDQGLEFKLEVDDSFPQRFVTDPTRLRQCLINLVSNAIKFTQAGFVHVKADQVVESDGQEMLRFVVSDSGMGIAPENQQQIFEPFVQAETSTTRNYGGTGLGLSLTRQLIELMGGSLSLQSQVGQGSSFTMTIPYLKDAAPEPESSDSTDTPAGSDEDLSDDSYRSLRILIAEDNPVNALLLKKLLKRHGIIPDTVGNGQEAVDQASQTPYDIIFMDIQMPVMNGYDATRILRERNNPAAIIALTANAMQQDKELCLEAGCIDYLSKPVRWQELEKMLKKYCASQNMPSESLC